MPNDNRPPAFMFYPADFASDGKVEAMTTEEVGAYILLLCKAWREEPPGSVPDDDRVLARWARLTSDQWSAARSAVLDAFTQGKDGRWYQPRMVREFEKQRSFAKSRHNAAKVAAAKRWEDKPDDAPSMRHASGTHPPRMPDAGSSSSSSEKNKKHAHAQEPSQIGGVLQAIQQATGVLEGDLVGERKLRDATETALAQGISVTDIEQFSREKGPIQIAFFLSAIGTWLKTRTNGKPKQEAPATCGNCKTGWIAVDPTDDRKGMKRCVCNPNRTRNQATAQR